MSPSCRKKNGGFTLIEVLVSVTLLSVVMLLVYSTTSQTLSSKERVDKRREAHHSIRVALSKVAQDVSMAFLISGADHLGKRGGSESVKTVFRSLNNGEKDALYFASLGHLRLFQNAKEGDACEVGYRVDSDPENPDAFQILRRESKEIDANPEEGGVWLPLVGGAQTFQLEFYDAVKKEWTEEWDSSGDVRKNRLPRGVRIGISVNNPDNPEEPLLFKTVSLLGMYANAIDF